MDDALQRQSVGERRILVGPSQRYRGNGHHEARQLQRVDYLLGVIHRGAEEAVAESFLVGEVAEGLGIQQCVGGCIQEREQIVVSRRRLAVFCPSCGAVEISTDGEHHRRLRNHRLTEMRRRELLFHLCRTCHHHAVELQVSHRLGTHCLSEEPVEEFVAYGLVGILSYSLSRVYRFHSVLSLHYFKIVSSLYERNIQAKIYIISRTPSSSAEKYSFLYSA